MHLGTAMSHRTAALTSQLTTLQLQTEYAAKELSADQDGIAEFNRQLQSLRLEKDRIRRELRRDEHWLQWYEGQVEPHLDKFDNLGHELGALYAAAKSKHAAGIELLTREFDYHPAFRRPGDVISAKSTYTPK